MAKLEWRKARSFSPDPARTRSVDNEPVPPQKSAQAKKNGKSKSRPVRISESTRQLQDINSRNETPLLRAWRSGYAKQLANRKPAGKARTTQKTDVPNSSSASLPSLSDRIHALMKKWSARD